MKHFSVLKGSQVLLMTGIMVFVTISAMAKESVKSLVDPQALVILNRASSYLEEQKQYSMSAEIWEDVALNSKTNIQLAKTVDINLRRPDRVKIQVATTEPEKTYLYNGEDITVLDQLSGFFGVASASSSIDKTLKNMDEKYGITFPLDDVLMSKPYIESAEKSDAGQYLGVERIFGKTCHHLAFQHDQVDWQVWIEDGSAPLLRKAVISHKQEAGTPQYTAIFKTWDFQTELPDYLFNFDKTSNFIQIDMLESVPMKNSPTPKQ